MAHDPRAVLDRPAPPPAATVRYGSDAEQVADLRLPAASGPPRPLLVVVHGGFWRAAYDRTHTAPLAVDLAARGYLVAQLEYRRTGQPGGGWPGTFEDIRAGVAALPALVPAAAAAAGRPAPAPGPPVLLGHSAGGQLALWAAADRPAGVRAVLALAPVADLRTAYRLGLDDDAVAALLGGGPDQVPGRYAEVDPSTRPAPVPTIVIHGDRDRQVPLAQSRAYADAAGDRCRLMVLPGVEHFAVIDPVSSAWPAVVSALSSLTG